MTDYTDEIKEHRKPNYDINPTLLNRWSARAMTGEELSDDELMPLFEAARWAPSSGNGQPWRFIYVKRGSEQWDPLFATLMEGNQAWVKNAGVMVVVVSRKFKEHNESPYPTHSFDAGAAWENLAIEGVSRGLVVHAMGGFDYDKAGEVLGVPENFEVHCTIAIGKRGKKEDLPEQMQEREFPSDRRPFEEIVMQDRFKE